MRTVYLNAVLLPGGRAALGDRDGGDHPLRRLPGDRRQHRDRDRGRVHRLPAAVLRPDPADLASSTRPTSRGWRRSTRSSTCSTPSPTWSTRPDAIDPGQLRGEIELDDVWFSYARGGDATAAELDRRTATDRSRGRLGAGGHRPARAGRARRWRWSARRRRQVDAGEAGRALLRPAARPGAGRRPRPARAELARRCAASSGSCPRRGSCSRGTIRENIAFGRPDASEEEIVAAAARGRRRARSSTACRRASTPRSASAARSSRPASARSSPSPGRCSPSRGS